MRGFFAGSTLASTRKPPSTVALCGACGLYMGCHSPKMEVSGQGRKGILVVAEAPGREEDLQGHQLVGKAGQRLRRVLDKFGVDLDLDCWKTNSIICRPPKNRTPTSQEIEYCRPNLMRTVADTKPHTILLLGAVAVEAHLGPIWGEDTGSLERWVGWQVPQHQPAAWVCPTYHPSYLERTQNPMLDRLFEQHIEAALGLREGPWPQGPPDYGARVEKLRDAAAAARILDEMVRRGGPVAFDYETNMLKPDGDAAEIVSCAVSYRGRRTIAFPWDGPVVPAMSRLLRAPNPKVAANLKFEQRWTWQVLGHGVRNWVWDTMQAAHVLQNTPKSTSLNFQALVNFGVAPYDHHIKKFLKVKGAGRARRTNQILKEIDLDDLLRYNGMDALLEYMLAERQLAAWGLTLEEYCAR